MLHLDSGYAIESAVGPVFDLTKWTGRGRIGMGLAVLAFGLGFLTAVAFAWNTSWFFKVPPDGIKDAIADMNGAWRTHPTAMWAGVAVGSLLGVLCLLGASNLFSVAFRNDFDSAAATRRFDRARGEVGLDFFHLLLHSRSLFHEFADAGHKLNFRFAILDF